MRLCDSLPTSRSGRILGDQVFRSGVSVAVNYREAFRDRSRAEFVSKLGEAQRELEETILWLELLAESGAAKANRLSLLQAEAGELMAILTSRIKTARNRD